jgi:predicted dithiol-disulfide oxidoreductase (DUF899 family)
MAKLTTFGLDVAKNSFADHGFAQPILALFRRNPRPHLTTAKGAVIMDKTVTSETGLPPVVSPAEWNKASKKLLAKEKAQTRARDKLAAERRRLPMVLIDKDYVFEGPQGKQSLLDLFEGRHQLIVYHFMFAPGVQGWPDAGCPGCSFFVDNIGHPAHLHARDTSLALISLAPIEKIEAYKRRMGWRLPWVSSHNNSFNTDLGLSTPDGETFGLSVFLRDGEKIHRTYFTAGRGVEALGSAWTFLDLTPFGRQEFWEDTPPGRPQSEPYVWWRRHDEYGG